MIQRLSQDDATTADADTDNPLSVPMTLDTSSSQMTQNSNNEIPKKSVKLPVPTSSRSGSMVDGEAEPVGVTYESLSTSRPRRNAGVVGEMRRREVERK